MKTPHKTTPKPLPKARQTGAALWSDKCLQSLERTSVLRCGEFGATHVNVPVAVLPASSLKAARELVRVGRFWQLGEGERVERVAKALHEAQRFSFSKGPWSFLSGEARDGLIRQARAILALLENGGGK